MAAEAAARRVNLALQGGGSHGAFTWGVLEAVLEDERVEIEGISGTSAGAMNAVVLASAIARHNSRGAGSYCEKARRAAIDALGAFWRSISAYSSLNPVKRAPMDTLFGLWGVQDNPAQFWAETFAKTFSPYQFNPLDINPVRELLKQHVDFDALATPLAPKVFVAATRVRTGKAEIFSGKRLCPEAVAASACLPMLFQAVEVEDDWFWDGGFAGNPALHPLIYECRSADIVLVQINPVVREDLPTSSRDILDRMNEITFNASLLAEMRAIDFVARLLKDGKLDPSRYKHVLMHRIGGDELAKFGASSKLATDGAFINELHALGLAAGRDWLARNHAALGERGTVNIARDYLDDLRIPVRTTNGTRAPGT
ncbi:MAG TPA: patatin-like phospholipase family protein [Burkholderiaceae bacterium]|nr:patatin-like phospholipase family protein [Burkholderiaceae bacterium]